MPNKNGEITYKEVVRAAEKVVARKGGDFVYNAPAKYDDSCVYFVQTDEGDRHPSCLVGAVLFEFDILDQLEARANEEGWSDVSDWFSFTEKANIFLNEIQDRQDRQVPWGLALLEAKQAVEREYAEEALAYA